MMKGVSIPKTLLLASACILVATLIHTLLLRQVDFSWTLAATDAVISQALVSLGMTALIVLMRYYRPGKQNLWRLFDWTIVMAAAIFFLQQYALRQLDADETYALFLKRTWIVRGLIDWLILVIATMAGWLLYYWNEQQEAESRKAQSERLARETELSALRQQLQPHFLFNSLNSISALAGTRPEEARKMVQQLSDFLRGTIRRDDQTLVTLEEDLQHLRLYLDIEKVRFGHRLNVDISTDERCAAMKLPPLLLQPVVENAIKFGLYDTVGEITIRIHAGVEDQALLLEVSNPFDPATSVPQKGTGFGLSSLRRRLYLLFSRNDLLSVKQEDHHFTTQIRIPQS